MTPIKRIKRQKFAYRIFRCKMSEADDINRPRRCDTHCSDNSVGPRPSDTTSRDTHIRADPKYAFRVQFASLL